MSDLASAKLRRRAQAFTNDHDYLINKPARDTDGTAELRARSVRMETFKALSNELRAIADELEREGQ